MRFLTDWIRRNVRGLPGEVPQAQQAGGHQGLKEEFSSDAGFVKKFKMEAQAAAGLSHPNIVSVYDVVDEGSIHYIVMELIEGSP